MATTRDIQTLAVSRKPIFRSSAIFPAINLPNTKTRLCFLGYWKLKRDVPEIAALITVRSEEGDIVSRTNRAIKEARAFRVELSDQLASSGFDPESPFRGSIEIEFFSSVNLVFPYPAVLVNYYGPNFSSVVHTAQRVFNDAEDAGENMETAVPESGFNVYADTDREPFFAFINGFEAVEDCKVDMTFYNCDREVLRHQFTIPEVRPYQAVFVQPCEQVDLKPFLKGKVGAAKVTFDSRWVFARIIAGNWQNSLDAVGITHTYYDCTAAATDSDYWLPSDPAWYPASLEIPLVVHGDFFTNVYFYPIISPSILEFAAEIYSLDGRLLGKAENVLEIQSPAASYFPIRLKEVCRALGIAADQEMTARIIAAPVEGSRLPSRIKVGLDIGQRSDRLPCNICTNLRVFDPASEKKNRTFRWAPLLADQGNPSIWILNGSAAIDHKRTATIQVAFYREADCQSLQRTIVLTPNEAAVIRVKGDRELTEFFGGLPGWCTMVSDSPYTTSFYFVEHATGIVGGDHAF